MAMLDMVACCRKFSHGRETISCSAQSQASIMGLVAEDQVLELSFVPDLLKSLSANFVHLEILSSFQGHLRQIQSGTASTVTLIGLQLLARLFVCGVALCLIIETQLKATVCIFGTSMPISLKKKGETNMSALPSRLTAQPNSSK